MDFCPSVSTKSAGFTSYNIIHMIFVQNGSPKKAAAEISQTRGFQEAQIGSNWRVNFRNF